MLLTKWSMCLVCCALAGAAAADAYFQGTPTRKPGPEHRNLARLAGTWKFEGTLKPGPGGPGGPISSSETCRMFETFLLCDSEESGAAGRVNTHSMSIYHPVQKKYQRFSVSNASPYQDYYEGTYNGDTWTWSNELNIDGKKVLGLSTFTEASPTVHSSRVKISQDGGKTWTTIMEGQLTKQ